MSAKMKKLPRCYLYDEKYTFRNPMMRYLKRLVSTTSLYESELYFYNISENQLAIQGNVMALCNLLSTANSLFIKEGLSFDRALLEHHQTGNMNRVGRLWFFFKPSSSDNSMRLDVEPMKYDNIELY